MRLFNLFRLGSKRLKFDDDSFRKDQKLGELNKIQDMVVTQTEREILVRNELKKVQEELSKKCLELEKLKSSFDLQENEKTKLKILMQSKEKKIEQKERELEEMRNILEDKDMQIAQPQQTQEPPKHSEKSEGGPKLSSLRKEKKFKKP
jgi:16S rRNA C1402 (ribose-2'-O) methylase RsmI